MSTRLHGAACCFNALRALSPDQTMLAALLAACERPRAHRLRCGVIRFTTHAVPARLFSSVLVQLRRPSRIGGVARRLQHLLVAAGHIHRIEHRPGIPAGVAEEHDDAPVRRPSRSFAFGENALARSVRAHEGRKRARRASIWSRARNPKRSATWPNARESIRVPWRQSRQAALQHGDDGGAAAHGTRRHHRTRLSVHVSRLGSRAPISLTKLSRRRSRMRSGTRWRLHIAAVI